MKSGFKKWASGLIVTGALAGSIAFTGCERVYVCGQFDEYKEEYCRQPKKRRAPWCSKHTSEWAKLSRRIDQRSKQYELQRCMWYFSSTEKFCSNARSRKSTRCYLHKGWR